MSIQPGNEAPDFPLTTRDGRQTTLHGLLKEKVVVLYFYPRNDTPVCTREACHFRDDYQQFVDRGAEVVGVSTDSAESDEAFASRHRLPFTLVSDEDGAVSAAYGVERAFFGLMPARVTFVIDQRGVVRHAFKAQMSARKHVDEALEALARLG